MKKDAEKKIGSLVRRLSELDLKIQETIGFLRGSVDKWDIPESLSGLDLYENDLQLCRAWPKTMEKLTEKYNEDDIVLEIMAAHAWEMKQPVEKRKIQRNAFLTRWIPKTLRERNEKGRYASRPTTNTGNQG